MSSQPIVKLRLLSKLLNIKTKPVKKQGRIARLYRPMQEHYLKTITELNMQKEINKLALEVIIELLTVIKQNHPLFF